MLPRLAYHNPSIPITVTRNATQDSPCVLSVHLASDTAEDAQTPSPSSNVLTIDMKRKQESEILSQLIQATGAKQVEPTAEEVEMMRDLEEQKGKSEKDSRRSLAHRAQWKKEQDMLKAAREGAL
jgi:large subunit ribosomal protein MRP49